MDQDKQEMLKLAHRLRDEWGPEALKMANSINACLTPVFGNQAEIVSHKADYLPYFLFDLANTLIDEFQDCNHPTKRKKVNRNLKKRERKVTMKLR